MNAMTKYERELAERLVSHPAWRWVPGMVVTMIESGDFDVVARVNDFGVARLSDGTECVAWRCLPDLSSWATIGIVEGQIRERRKGDYYAIKSLSPHMHGRDYYAYGVRKPIEGRSWGEAIALAWLAAHGER